MGDRGGNLRFGLSGIAKLNGQGQASFFAIYSERKAFGHMMINVQTENGKVIHLRLLICLL